MENNISLSPQSRSKNLNVMNKREENQPGEMNAQIMNTNTHEVFNLIKDVEYIGRCPRALVILKDIVVSRRHCLFFKQPDGSYNVISEGLSGTSLNGVVLLNDIPRGCPLKTGDVISILNYSFEFKYTTGPKDKQTVADIPKVLNMSVQEQRAQFDQSQKKEREKFDRSLIDLTEKRDDIARNLNALKFEKLNNSLNWSQELNLEKDGLIKEMEAKLKKFKKKEEKWLKDKNEMESLMMIQKKEHEERLSKLLAEQFELCQETKHKLEQEHNEVNKKLRKELASNEETAIDIIESLECGICTELIIEAILLNCGHSFCKFCVTEWKKKKKECPVCRTNIKNETRSFSFDNLISKLEKRLSPEDQKAREELIKKRNDVKIESAKKARGKRGRNRSRNTQTIYISSGTNLSNHDPFHFPTDANNQETLQHIIPGTQTRLRIRAHPSPRSRRIGSGNLSEIQTFIDLIPNLEANHTVTRQGNTGDSVNSTGQNMLTFDMMQSPNADLTIIDLTNST